MIPEKRVKFNYEDSRVGFSVPADTSDEDIEKAMLSVIESIKKIKAFDELPEIDRVKYYLALTSKALLSIMNRAKVDCKDYDREYTAEYVHNLLAKLTGISMSADMAIIQIPDQYRTSDIKL